MKWLGELLGLVRLLVEWLLSPRRRRERLRREVDRAVGEGDAKRVNEILDRHLGR